MGPPSLDRLTRRERELVESLLALSNRASVEEIRQRLSAPPSYSAVRALLARLEAKGAVRHVEEGARYIYSVTVSPRRVRRAALRQHVRVFWEGSRRRLIAALLRDEDWGEEELEQLKAAIEEAQAAKGDRSL